VEVASLALLVVVLLAKPPGTMGKALLFLLPVAFGLHVTEEFIWPGGFIAWDNIYRPQYTDSAGSYYVRVNAIPAVSLFLLGLLALSKPAEYIGSVVPTWLTIAAFMSWNALFHLRGAIRTRRYSPGMMTGLTLLLPLTIAGFVHFLHAGLPPWIAAVSGAMAFTLQPVLNLIKRIGLKMAA